MKEFQDELTSGGFLKSVAPATALVDAPDWEISEGHGHLRILKQEQEKLQTARKSINSKDDAEKLRLTELQLHGRGSLAYSSLQGGLQYFSCPDTEKAPGTSLGYLAYRQLSDSQDSVVVLSDPICSRENEQRLLEEFFKIKKDAVFLHVSYDTAQVLARMGFSVNQLGVETVLDIQTFNLVGTKKEQLRRARNGALKDNLTVSEIVSVDDLTLADLKRVSDEWLKTSVAGSRDMQFIVRPLVFVDEIDVRKFVALQDGQIVGFVVFDPIYEQGKVVGYTANQLRTNLDRTYSVVDFIILEALAQFRLEGKTKLSLGLSPLAKVADSDEFRHSRLLKAHFKFAFENANYLYNFKNLARHKSLYRPGMPGAREEKVYCAMHTRFLLVRIYEVYHVLGLQPVRQTMRAGHKVLLDKMDGIARGLPAPDAFSASVVVSALQNLFQCYYTT